MKASERIAFTSVGLGAAAGLALWWSVPGLPWWIYAFVVVGAIASFQQGGMEHAAHKRIIDGGGEHDCMTRYANCSPSEQCGPRRVLS